MTVKKITKISEISVENLTDYLRIDFNELSDGEKAEIETLLTVAVSFIKSYTGLGDDKIDEHADFIIVVYIIVQDMYDNRVLYVDKSNLNKVVDTILGMHSVNLL